jgi:methionine-S-sulfoxide reductase
VLFGAGCFWGVEDAFMKVKGVTSTRVGYSGGSTKNPSYEDVCSHGTGHAEVVEAEYDPAHLSFAALLDVFWASHNPTTRNRQGPDVGDQYRSAIFFATPEQESAARASAAKLEQSGKLSGSITTQIELAAPFYAAEEYHQKYHQKHGGGTCRVQ